MRAALAFNGFRFVNIDVMFQPRISVRDVTSIIILLPIFERSLSFWLGFSVNEYLLLTDYNAVIVLKKRQLGIFGSGINFH